MKVYVITVILFVRMWVEMHLLPLVIMFFFVILFVRMWVEILPKEPRELGKKSHPLREDVSWNMFQDMSVSFYKSSSSWGCELKFSKHLCMESRITVILFVRMWVEISKVKRDLWIYAVILFVRIWVEISDTPILSTHLSSHPLREDVSWNKPSSNPESYEYLSSSSWGCELKYQGHDVPILSDIVILFMRMWVEIHFLR